MGCDVVVAGARPRTVAKVRALFDLYDETFSRFKAGSELVRLNAAGGGAMSPLYREVLDIALWASRETGGLVDPRVGAAVVGAGYDRDFAAGLDRSEPPAPGARPGPSCGGPARSFGWEPGCSSI